MRQLLDEIGLGGERLDMFFLSSAEGIRWSEIVIEMTERIKALGPNPLRDAAAEHSEGADNDCC